MFFLRLKTSIIKSNSHAIIGGCLINKKKAREEMDLELKHLGERNRLAYFINFVIVCSCLLLTVLNVMSGVAIPGVVKIIACVVDVVINIVGYKAYKNQAKYRHICCLSICAWSMIILAMSIENYMYAYIFAIAVMVMIFQDLKITMIGGSCAILETIGFMVMCVMRGNTSTAMAITDVALVLITVFMCFKVTQQQQKHRKESEDALFENMGAHEKVANEIVALAKELNIKFNEAKGVSEELTQSMEDSYAAVSEIAESSKNNADAITNQTAQTVDIQNSIEAVGTEAEKMKDVSEQTNTSVIEGVHLIEQLQKQAEGVVKINVETRETTQALNDSIKDVEAITTTILGISNQTNLLALNASIEAARAGEAGKGFAVVADEIRQLSEGTRQATEQITEIIERLAKDAESAAESMTQSAEFADKQNELIEETGTKLTDIKKETEILYNGVIEVRNSVESVIEANSVIMDNITNLSATGEEVAASTETTLQLSDKCVEGLENMNHLLEGINQISSHMQDLANKN